MHLADGRNKSEWARTATLATWFHRSLTGESIEPAWVIPKRYRPPMPKPAPRTEEQDRRDTQAALTLIGSFLTQGS